MGCVQWEWPPQQQTKQMLCGPPSAIHPTNPSQMIVTIRLSSDGDFLNPSNFSSAMKKDDSRKTFLHFFPNNLPTIGTGVRIRPDHIVFCIADPAHRHQKRKCLFNSRHGKYLVHQLASQDPRDDGNGASVKRTEFVPPLQRQSSRRHPKEVCRG